MSRKNTTKVKKIIVSTLALMMLASLTMGCGNNGAVDVPVAVSPSSVEVVMPTPEVEVEDTVIEDAVEEAVQTFLNLYQSNARTDKLDEIKGLLELEEITTLEALLTTVEDDKLTVLASLYENWNLADVTNLEAADNEEKVAAVLSHAFSLDVLTNGDNAELTETVKSLSETQKQALLQVTSNNLIEDDAEVEENLEVDYLAQSYVDNEDENKLSEDLLLEEDGSLIDNVLNLINELDPVPEPTPTPTPTTQTSSGTGNGGSGVTQDTPVPATPATTTTTNSSGLTAEQQAAANAFLAMAEASANAGTVYDGWQGGDMSQGGGSGGVIVWN